MIRIDEIYTNTFWSWIHQNVPGMRMWFCDPPGTSSPNDLMLHGNNNDQYYIYFHDQEPIYLDYHKPMFDSLINKNFDIYPYADTKQEKRALVTSEYRSASVNYISENYNYKSYYYFFHGWAALDWYRGYDKTFLMPEPQQRNIEHSFISPNRIVGGRRDHRVLMLYNLLYRNIQNAQISFPDVCPVEKTSVVDIAHKYQNVYSKITQTIADANLPWHFENEDNHPMTSCWLDLFDQSSKCLAYLVSETSYFGKKNHLTEKTFKPICLKMPFIIASNAHSLKYLKSYGFETFNEYWDEGYDDIENDYYRSGEIANLCSSLDRMSSKQLNNLRKDIQPIVEYNYNHFYSGEFEKILWNELQSMLEQIKIDFCIR